MSPEVVPSVRGHRPEESAGRRTACTAGESEQLPGPSPQGQTRQGQTRWSEPASCKAGLTRHRECLY